MRRRAYLIACVLYLATGLSTAQAAIKYWDINGANTGGSDVPTTADGTWSAGGGAALGDYNNNTFVDAADFAIWRLNEGSLTPLPNDGGTATPVGTAHYDLWRANFGATGGAGGVWSTDPNGLIATTGWTAGDSAVFSAGTNVTGTSAITLSGTQSADGITFEEGAVTIAGGTELTLTGAASIGVTSPATGTINSVIGGGAGLTKTGTGTLTLGGANTYTVGTTLNGGVTAISADNNLGAAGTGLTFNAATLRTNAAIPAFSRSITMTGIGTVNTNGFDSTFSSVFSGGTTGNFTKSGAGVLTLSGISPAFSGSLTVASGGGTLKVTDSGAFGVTGTATTTSAVLVNTGGTLELTDNVNVPDRIFINTSGGIIRKTGTGNTTITGGISFSAAGSVIADAGTLTITTGASFGPGQPTFGGAGNIVTTSSPNTNLAVAAARIVKNGSGKLTLNGNSSWTGGIRIDQGVVEFSKGDSTGSQPLGAVAALTPDNVILDGGTLRTAFVNSTVLVGSSSTYRMLITNRGMQIGLNGGTLDMAQTPLNGTFANPIAFFAGSIGEVTASDVTTFTKTGAGELRLDGAGQVHTFDKLVLKAGLYTLGQSSTLGQDTQLGAIPTSPLDDAVTLDGGTLRFNGGLSSTVITLDVNRGVTLNTTGGALETVGSSAAIPGKISGLGNLTKTGTLTLTLSGNNTYAGATLVNVGTLVMTGTNSYAGGTTVIGNATLGVNADAALGAVPGSPVANNIVLGNTTTAGALRADVSLTVDPNRGITLGTFGGTLNAPVGVVGNYNGVITGAGSLLKSGAGTWVLGGSNTYTGITTIFTNGSVLSISADANLGTAPGTPVATGITLGGGSSNGTLQTTASLTLNANRGILLQTGTGTGGTLDVINSSTLTVAGPISGTNALLKTGDGILELTNTNTNTGLLTVDTGTLNVNGSSATASGGDVTVNTGGIMRILSGVTGAIADGASLSLAGGGATGVADQGYLELGINETVNKLFLAGVPQLLGTYGATGSGATIIDDEYFSGSGILNVLNNAPGFGSGAAVPEPTTGLLLIMGLAALATGRRRNR